MSGVDGCREQTGERGVVEEGRFSEPGARRPQGDRQSQAGAWEEGARDREQRCRSPEAGGPRWPAAGASHAEAGVAVLETVASPVVTRQALESGPRGATS